MRFRQNFDGTRTLGLGVALVVAATSWGCTATGTTPDGGGDGDQGVGASPGVGDGDGDADGTGSTGGDSINVGDGDGDSDGAGGTGELIKGDPVDPCTVAGCGAGQRCEMTDEVATCIDLSCEELACLETEECRPHELGGNTCVNLLCVEDVDCDATDYCSESGDCVADVCTAGENSCQADGVHVCASNGSSEEIPYSCGGKAYFESTCGTESGLAACSCEDDWDCPEFTVCDVDHCVGTGFEPTCTLPPTDFNETKPAVELHWGTDSAGAAAHDGSGDGSSPPWPNSTEVGATPMVVNLDDDNGDGLVNELDFPEIVFVSYTADSVDNSGIMRAIHGGGPNRGKDFWAVCGGGDNPDVWHEGDALPGASCNGVGRSRSPAAIGDINADGLPEIVQVTGNNGFRILSNTGDVLISLPNEGAIKNDGISLSPTIANLDYAGLPEIILGGSVFTLDLDDSGALFIDRRLDIPSGGTAGANGSGGNRGGPMTCIADLTPDAGQEIVAGPTVYRMPASGNTLEVVWTASGLLASEGLCAVADIWGADSGARPGPANRPDGRPEVILIGEANLMILDGATGAVIHQEDMDPADTQEMRRGGAPNVDDFDGDGFLEIASALSNFYVVLDLQEATATCPAWDTSLPREADALNNPNTLRDAGSVTCTADADCGDGTVCNVQANTCVCLHNGWKRLSDDSSSKLTSSSVFDFNGDGAAEVLYNDECDLRIYNGLDGAVHFSTISRGRTWTENPVVADVDNDGNAEVVTFANTEQNQDRCDLDGRNPIGPNGIHVYGDPQDTWVPARRIWNQQSYHVTNVTEGGLIPLHPAESWGDFNGLTYNTYRSQPRSFGVAPDLTVSGVGIFSPNAECGTLSDVINITFEVSNIGDLRVGPGVELQFFGTWAGVEEPLSAADGAPLVATLADGIDPGRSLIGTVTFEVANQAGQTALPEEVRVVVDTGGAGSGFGAERECQEDNNSATKTIAAGEALADLTVVLGAASVDCTQDPSVAAVSVTVTNSALVTANGVVVQIFAGNPAQGGSPMSQVTLPDPLGPGESVTLDVGIADFPDNREVTLWGFVDPGNLVSECNEADNTEAADNPIECVEVVVVLK